MVAACVEWGIQWWRESGRDALKQQGPIIAGMFFGAGWSMWCDAVIMHGKVPFVHWLGGILATLSALFLNMVSKGDLDSAGAGGYSIDGAEKRVRLYLLLVYVMSFSALAVSVGVLITDYADKPDKDPWPGIAGVLQTTCVLGSGMVYFQTQGAEDDAYGSW